MREFEIKLENQNETFYSSFITKSLGAKEVKIAVKFIIVDGLKLKKQKASHPFFVEIFRPCTRFHLHRYWQFNFDRTKRGFLEVFLVQTESHFGCQKFWVHFWRFFGTFIGGSGPSISIKSSSSR